MTHSRTDVDPWYEQTAGTLRRLFQECGNGMSGPDRLTLTKNTAPEHIILWVAFRRTIEELGSMDTGKSDELWAIISFEYAAIEIYHASRDSFRVKPFLASLGSLSPQRGCMGRVV